MGSSPPLYQSAICLINDLYVATGKEYSAVYMVGGGTKDRFLSQLTAYSCGCTVSSGPVEATALGSIAIQLMAMGEISGLAEAREIVRSSERIYTFLPEDADKWEAAYKKYKEVTANA